MRIRSFPAPVLGVLALLSAGAAACESTAPAPPPPQSPTVAPVTTAGPVATAPAAAENQDDPAVDAAEKAYLDFLVANSPEEATALGLHARDTELDDYTVPGAEARIKHEEEMLSSLKARFASAHLSLAKKIDLELLEHGLEVSIRVARDEEPLVRSPEGYAQPLETLFNMISRPYAPAPDRAHAVVARLEKLPLVYAAAKANLKNPPQIWTQTAIEAFREAPSFLTEVKAFLDSAHAVDPKRVEHAIGVARDAFVDYEKFLEHDLLARSKGDFAAGRPLFDFLLHDSYFIGEDADGVLALGERVFKETDEQMTALAKKIDPKAKDWAEVTKRLKSKHPTADDLIPAFKRQLDRARAFVQQKDIVTFPPDDDCVVMETPAFQRSTVTAAYEGAPPFDTATSRGFFFVTPVDKWMTAKQKEELLRENYDAEQADTVVHETYPGHHLQISLSRRHPSLIRKAMGTSLFSEGWGLYVEELMNELGYYSDEERLVELDWTLVRAARVMIDVGLHTKGMTPEQAVALLTDKVHLEKTLAWSEVKRYTATPTQPLSYLIGREKIFALREEFKKKDPEHFTLKRFHDDFLSHGEMPQKLVAEEMGLAGK